MPYRTLSHAGPSPQPQPSYVAGPGDLPQHEHDQPAEGRRFNNNNNNNNIDNNDNICYRT